MFCAYCGTKVPDEAKFCMACGKQIMANPDKGVLASDKVSNSDDTISLAASDAASNPDDAISMAASRLVEESHNRNNAFADFNMNYQTGESHSNTQQLITNSINYMENSTTGYYCLGCGNYIDYRMLKSQGLEECQRCNTHAVAVKAPTLANGWGMRLFNNLVNGTFDPYIEIKNYYNSDYYKSTGYTFEKVALDKGLVGEYMLDIELQKIRKWHPNKKFRVFYNVIIPEPNGSFQEIDALIFYGGFIFFIESKNRSGRYQYQHLTDKNWTFINDSAKTEVHNPLFQNEEHITAFQAYYWKAVRAFYPDRSSNLTRWHTFNYVNLGPDGDFNSTIEMDEFDKIILSENTFVYCGLGFHTQIEKMMDEIDAFNGGTSDFELADAQINVLKDILYMSQADKDLLKRNREEDIRYKGKTDYRYYYAYVECKTMTKEGVKDTIACMLLRTNGLYTQFLVNERWGWDMNDEVVFVNDHFELNHHMFNSNTKIIDLKNMPLEIVKAYRCVLNKTLYVPEN